MGSRFWKITTRSFRIWQRSWCRFKRTLRSGNGLHQLSLGLENRMKVFLGPVVPHFIKTIH